MYTLLNYQSKMFSVVFCLVKDIDKLATQD